MTVEATGPVGPVADAVQRLQHRGLACRLVPGSAYADTPKNHVTLVAEAHAGVENPPAEEQMRVLDTVQAVLKEVGSEVRLRSHGVAMVSSLDLRVVVDENGDDLGLKLWARDAAEADKQLDRIAEFTGCPREHLFTAALVSPPSQHEIDEAYGG